MNEIVKWRTKCVCVKKSLRQFRNKLNVHIPFIQGESFLDFTIGYLEVKRVGKIMVLSERN